jgi:fatty acid desaturase
VTPRDTDRPDAVSDTSHYGRASKELRDALSRALPGDILADLQRKRPWRHFLVLGRMLVLLAVGVTGSAIFEVWYAWLPFAVISGFTLFGFTILLHEVVHGTVTNGRSEPTLLGWLYAFPSGLSRTQFRRWHLDHHAELGDAVADPKRHHLSPRKNARWLKALYLTPALFFIYFRGAAREAATYPPEVRARIRRERLVTVGGQLGILATIAVAGDVWLAFKVYVVPYFLVFPVAFTVNRLGQHYDIDPSDPAKWSSLVAPSRFWDFTFLWSSYHLEHHYFPGVPFYNLRRLHVALQPFFAERGLVPTTYRRLLWLWFVKNRAPHTRWSAAR